MSRHQKHLSREVKTKVQCRARRHGRSAEGDAVKDEGAPRAPLGARLAARFARIGLTEDIPELRCQPALPADFST
jgi:antitoxin FitA